jgi:AcrR family transcriptional regulator
MAATEPRSTLAPQVEAIRDAARELLEREGPDGLSMRRLSVRLGVHPPTLYRHFQDKRAVENAIASQCFWECGDAMLDALDDAEDPLTAITQAYRRWGLAHPHLYRLVFGRPLDRGLDRDAMLHIGSAIREVAVGDRTAARAIWACVHGLVVLEIDDRFPPGSDLDAIWRFTLDALRAQLAR